MSIRKRNEFLEGDESDEELDNGYDSEEVEESRAGVSGNKRRRLETVLDDESLNGLDDGHEDEEAEEARNDEDLEALSDLQEDDDQVANLAVERRSKSSSLKLSTPKQVAAAQKAARRSGVVYISRVPPFMKPQTLKHFLAPHASKGLGQIFLTPEDHSTHISRVKRGGNKKKSFVDGWVEFVSKREAQMAASTLNGHIMGGKKGNFYHDDLWSIKYLRGFKWSHLTEQVANENAERAARLREGIRKTRLEQRAFVENVERGRLVERMERTRVARGKGGVDGGGEFVKKGGGGKVFEQRAVLQERVGEPPAEQATQMHRKIFGEPT